MVTGSNSASPGVSIIIPAWNEAARLSATLAKYLPALENRGEPFEVIVVADGQSDDTYGVANAYSSRNVRSIVFPERLGKGGAVLAGFRAAKFDFVGYLDADGPVSPESVHDMIEVLRECDGVVASRWIAGSRIARPQRFARVVLGRGWNVLVRIVLFLPQKDTQCGAKFFRRSVVIPMLRAVAVTDWAFDVDLLFHLKKAGVQVRENPVTWSDGAGSKLQVHRAVPSMMLSLVGIRLMNMPFSKRIPRSWVTWFRKRWGNL